MGTLEKFRLYKAIGIVVLLACTVATRTQAQDGVFPLTNTEDVKVNRVLADAAKHNGRDALHVSEDPDSNCPGARPSPIVVPTKEAGAEPK